MKQLIPGEDIDDLQKILDAVAIGREARSAQNLVYLLSQQRNLQGGPVVHGRGIQAQKPMLDTYISRLVKFLEQHVVAIDRPVDFRANSGL